MFAAVVATGLAAQSNAPMVRYTATATNIDPTVALTATLVDISITRWSTDAEREGLRVILVEQGLDKLL